RRERPQEPLLPRSLRWSCAVIASAAWVLPRSASSSRLRRRARGAKEAPEEEQITPFMIGRELDDAERRAEVILSSKGFGSEEFQAESKRARLAAEDPNLWDDVVKAKEIMADLARVQVVESKAE
ncbi:unnamed protein product, partial [Polarella glacialis]